MIVANSTPLIALAGVGRLALLHGLYGGIVIPQEVWNEVVVEGAGRPGATEVAEAAWIAVETVADSGAVWDVQAAHPALGPGEAASITLAQERSATLVLLDDPVARRVARASGLRVAGTASALLDAKDAGLLSSVREVLDELRANRFRLSSGLYRDVLTAAGE